MSEWQKQILGRRKTQADSDSLDLVGVQFPCFFLLAIQLREQFRLAQKTMPGKRRKISVLGHVHPGTVPGWLLGMPSPRASAPGGG